MHSRHLRPGYCNKGARLFFARHGFCWADFLRNGIEADKLIATGDALAMKIVERARADRGR